LGYGLASGHEQIKKTEMLQKARAAFPLTKFRERAFEGAFFGVALIAMAGWVYFITLLLVRLFLWFFA
jgi:fatty acid desaturase